MLKQVQHSNLMFLSSPYLHYLQILNFANTLQRMNKEKAFVLGLSQTLFWDVDINTIDPEKHAPYIVERVLSRGTMEDFQSLKNYYGKTKIRDIAKSLRYLDDRVLYFCSAYFNTPITQFRCYTFKQSKHINWNY
jgi:hypothetical protein